MRVLAHIHTFNDEAVIDRSLGAILAQTRPVDGVVIVDNGSRDRTLEREFPALVTVIRHGENLGTSGAVRSGMAFALEHGYDWIWLFDADSAARPGALAALLDFYDSLSAEARAEVMRVASLPFNRANGRAIHGERFTPTGFETIEPPPGGAAYLCDGTIWSGSLFRTALLREVGLPSADYVLDWGEFVYSYHCIIRGFRTYMVPDSVFDHNIDEARGSSGTLRRIRLGPLGLSLADLPAIRFYYVIRNDLYFWLYEYQGRGARHITRMLPIWSWMPRLLVKLLLVGRWAEAKAALRGVIDGLFGRIGRRF